MIIEIPLLQASGQSFQIILNEQNCAIFLMERLGHVYCDLMIDNDYIWRAAICHDRSPIRNFKVQKFIGNLVFVDMNGTSDPHYQEFSERYRFFYITDDVKLDDTFQRRGTED